MDDSIKRKIVLHESDMDLDLQWSKLESRIKERQRRGLILYFLPVLVGVGILFYIIYNYSDILQESRSQSDQDILYADKMLKQTNEQTTSQSLGKNNLDDNPSNSSGEVTQKFEKQIYLPSDPTAKSNTTHTKVAKSKNNSEKVFVENPKDTRDISTQFQKEVPTKTIEHTDASSEKSSSKPELESPLAMISPIVPEMSYSARPIMIRYDYGRKIPIQKISPLLYGWFLDIGSYGNFRSNTLIKSENVSDENILDRKSLEMLNFNIGVHKQFGRSFSMGIGYEKQIVNEKFSSKGKGYYIRPVTNIIIASNPDQQSLVYGSANAVTEIQYNIVSYNQHKFDWLYLNPNYHLSVGKYDMQIGASYFYNLRTQYDFTNVSETGSKLTSEQKAKNANKISISLGLSRNISDHLQVGVTSSYIAGKWQYDLNNPTFEEPNILLQGSGINQYRGNGLNFGLNLRYSIK